MAEEKTQRVFQRLKEVCVPLLGSSLLTPNSTSHVSRLLEDLSTVLQDSKAIGINLTTNIISYTFFPLSTILRRNNASEIPDQVMEKIFLVLGFLCEDWWWECDLAIWEQIFMLCGAVIAGIDGKGKGRDRDDETKEAAGRCLIALLHDRASGGNPHTSTAPSQIRLEILRAHARTDKFQSILGRTFDSLLMVVNTHHLPLQLVCLELLQLFIDVYAPDDLIPSILPGVVSRMTRIALGDSTKKGWANGESVAGSLKVLRSSIVRAIGDDICVKEGAIQRIVELEDLAKLADDRQTVSRTGLRPFSTLRTPSWLRGTSSQLLIALNTLNPVMSHPTPSALLALSECSTTLLGATSMTMPDAQPLLVHWLLSLSSSNFPSVSTTSHASLLSLLSTSSEVRHSLQQTLLRATNDNLLALPRLLATHADAKIEHVAGIVEAVCSLSFSTVEARSSLPTISSGVAKLLGATGGIEKWGWSMLSVLELVEPPLSVSRTSSAVLMLENNSYMPSLATFPEVRFKNVFSGSTRIALERMFHALGRAAGDGCLYSVEWFVNVGRTGSGSRSVTAMWCACRLLEGVAEISLSTSTNGTVLLARRSSRLVKLARALARNVAELWDERGEENEPTLENEDDLNANSLVQHVKGLHTLHEALSIARTSPAGRNLPTRQKGLHKALSLQVLSISAGILQAQFTPLLLYTLYPVLRSLVSSDAYLSSTALATLDYITLVTSYASPANLLLTNFDYALDAVSRRLSRRWLDIEATKVLGLVVRLVGSDIIGRAGDIVEECFDRLDEFHGYNLVVEGLVEVLGDVINVIKDDQHNTQITGYVILRSPESSIGIIAEESYDITMDSFFQWFSHRHEKPDEDAGTSDYSPAPRETWKKDIPQSQDAAPQDADSNRSSPPTALQMLTKQIVSRSLYFLTHGSPVVRAQILLLLAGSVAVLPEAALLPSIHHAWPFILNRLADSESFVVGSAAILVESLAVHVGTFMFRRIWDDVWPKFHLLLNNLDTRHSTNVLSRRSVGAVGTDSPYTHSHRICRAIIRTMTAVVIGVHLQEVFTWQLLLAFRRFLHQEAHWELQQNTRRLYLAVAAKDPDVVWLVLSSTMDNTHVTTKFLVEQCWDISANAAIILQNYESSSTSS